MRNISSGSWKNPRQFKKKNLEFGKLNRKKKSLPRRALSTVVLIFFLFLFIGGTAAAAYYAWLLRYLPNPDKIIERQIEQTTKIYDRQGETLLYEIHGERNRTALELEDISKYVIWATLAAEDRDFYRHRGFSWRGIIRAALTNLVRRTRAGGSSITQQFVKNAVLTPEKTYTRKIKELFIAFQLEARFSKDEILKMYLNEIPYGSVTYGIESASWRFFGKAAKDLNIAEAAYLSALPKAPSYYSPYGPNREALERRYKYIIDAMAEEGYISKEEAAAVKGEDLSLRLQDKKVSILAPHFVFYVKDILSQMFGERSVEQGGIKVITTLDLEKQKLAEKILKENKKNINSYGGTNASLVAIEPPSGEVLAMAGSLDYFNKEIDGNVNVALRPRQPGSSFKPIVYAAGFLRGYTPNTILYDVETVFPTVIEKDGYAPKNYDLKEHGPVTVRSALAGSLNIPAVKMIYLAGIENVLDLASALGYTTFKDRSRFGLSLVLGGGEVKLLEHMAAYAVFANDGLSPGINPILKVEDARGKVIYEAKSKPRRVLDEEIVRQINDVLSDNTAREFIFGANNYLNLGFMAAAKTGTTNDYHDAWALGYTPELAVGVWVGNNNNKEMKRGADGSVLAAPIWNAFMKNAVKDKTRNFINPRPVITGKPILDGETMPGANVKIDKASGKLATDFTPSSFVIEKSFREVHDILHYVDRENPQGPAPADPTKDPYYNAWEESVRKWAEKQNIISELPPTGYDDLHVPINKPQISITSPQNNEAVGRSFAVSVKTSAPRGVFRVEYFIDEALIFTAKASPFYGQITLPSSIGGGFHTLKAITYDDIDNSNFHEININVGENGGAFWISPKNNAVISSFPFNITLNINKDLTVSLWYSKKDSANYYKIGETDGAGLVSLVWPHPGEMGVYEIKAVIKKPGLSEEKSINVIVQ